MRARLWLAVGATWAVATVGAAIFWAPAHADDSMTPAGASVGDAGEAWYDTSPSTLCSSPIGCPPVSLTRTSYAADTLHVGVMSGRASSETFVLPDLSPYVGGTLPTSGRMALPLATVADNGNSNPSTAAVKACLSKGVFKDGTSGSTSTPPATDCSVKATLVYAEGRFTLDLAPFLAAWSSGKPDDGIALVPDLTKANLTTSWQVAFNGRNLAGAPHIASNVAGGSPAGSDTSSVPVTTVAPTSAPVGSPAPDSSSAAPAPAITPSDQGVASGNPGVTPSLSGVNQSSPPGTALAASGASTPVGATGGGSSGFQYPEILLLPLLIAAGMLFVLRLLTSDATPKRLRARPIKKEAT